MNKILIDTRKYDLEIKNSDTYLIDTIQNDCSIKIKVLENVKAEIILFVKSSKVNIQIDLLENSHLIMNQLGINSSIHYSCSLLSSSNLFLVDSIISDIDSCNEIKLVHKEGYSNSKVIANGVNLDSNKLYFKIDGMIPKDSLEVNLEENSKIINLQDGDSKIIPNLIVDNKDIVASHSAFIGTFHKEDIWYLNSRGIDSDLAKKMLLKAILLNGMELRFSKDRFIKELI